MSRDAIVTKLVADDSGYGRVIDSAIGKNLRYQGSAGKVVSANDELSGSFRGLTTFARDTGTALKTVSVGVTGLATASVAAVSHVAQSAVEIENLARLANMSVEAFQAAAFATEQYGISAEKLADISKDVQDKLGDFIATGGGGFKDFFEQVAPKIGLTAQQLQGLSGTGVLGAVQSAMDEANVSAEEQVFYLEAIASDAALLTPLLKDNAAQLKELSGEYNSLGLAMSTVDIEVMREANQQIKLLSQSFRSGYAKAVVETAGALSDLASNEQAVEVATLGLYVAAGRLTGAITNKTAATYQGIQASRAAEKANVSRLVIEARAAKSAEVAARAELAQAQKQVSTYALLSQSTKQAAKAKQTLAAAQKNVAAAAQQATVAQNTLSAAITRGTVAARGLAVAGRALSGSLALMGGPAGVVMMAVGALAYMVTQSGEAEEANRRLADSTDDLITKLDTLTQKQLKVARLDASAAVRQLEADLKAVSSKIENTQTTVTIASYATGGKEIETTYQAGIDKVTRLEAKQEDLNTQLANTKQYLSEIDATLNRPPEDRKPTDRKGGSVSPLGGDELARRQTESARLLVSLDQHFADEQGRIKLAYDKRRQQIEQLALTEQEIRTRGYQNLANLQVAYNAANQANYEAALRVRREREQQEQERQFQREQQEQERKRQQATNWLTELQTQNASELEQLRLKKEEELNIAREYHEKGQLMEGEFKQAELELDKKYDRLRNQAQIKQKQMMLQNSSQLFGNLADMGAAFAGEQSGLYKGMFAVSKAFAIADSIIKIQQGIASAAALPFPANIPAMATVAAQTAGIVSTISGTQLTGMAHDGMTEIPREGTWLLDRGERVVDNRTNGDLKEFLNNQNKSANGSNWKIEVYNYANGTTVETSVDDRAEIVRIAVQEAESNTVRQLSKGGPIADAGTRHMGWQRRGSR